MCRNPSYNNIGFQPQCPKTEGAGYLRVQLRTAKNDNSVSSQAKIFGKNLTPDSDTGGSKTPESVEFEFFPRLFGLAKISARKMLTYVAVQARNNVVRRSRSTVSQLRTASKAIMAD